MQLSASQHSLDWHRQRHGNFTGSQVGRLMKSGRGKADIFSADAKKYMLKMGQYVEYTDKINGVGYPRMIVPAFTTDALILDRAEAYALKGDYTNAYADLTVWMNSFTSNNGTVDADMLKKTYGSMTAYYTPTVPTVKKRLDPDFTVSAGEQENLIHAILHARRVTTLHEGLRWQDVKRYGIEIVPVSVIEEAFRALFA
jgi:hypothetical protein